MSRGFLLDTNLLIGLELASDDSDIAKLEPLYTRLIEARSNLAPNNTNNLNNKENT